MLTRHGLLLSILGLSLPAFGAFVPQKIATGAMHTCVLSHEGEVRCWGENSSGALGTGDTYAYGFYPNSMGKHLPKVNLGTGMKASDICAGNQFSCAIVNDGKVKCWGSNTGGQLGQGTTGNVAMVGDKLPFTNLGATFKAKSLSCAAAHVCALTESGEAKCWGTNNSGQLGLGDTRNRGTAASDMGDQLPYVAHESKILSISAAGTSTTCALFTEGVRCWGSNNNGELGQESTAALGGTAATAGVKAPLVKVDGPNAKVWRLSSGERNSCVLYSASAEDAVKKVKCWGDNSQGYLGLGNTISHGATANSMGTNLPAVDLGMDDIIDIQAHYLGNCALSQGGKVKCWGFNSVGGLGQGDILPRGISPSEMGAHLPEVDVGLPVKSLSTGSYTGHTCTILINSDIKCWGWGTNGQLGYEAGINMGDMPNQMGEALPFVRLN